MTGLAYDNGRRLTEALLQVQGMQDQATRAACAEDVGSLIGSPLAYTHGSNPYLDNRNLIAACADHRGGLHGLACVLRDYHGASAPVMNFRELVDEVEPQWLLAERDRARLAGLLADRPLTMFAEVFAGLGLPAGSGFDRVDSAVGFVDRLEALGPPRSGHPVFVWVDGLAHHAAFGVVAAVDLHAWLTTLAGRYGLSESELRNLCTRTKSRQPVIDLTDVAESAKRDLAEVTTMGRSSLPAHSLSTAPHDVASGDELTSTTATEQSTHLAGTGLPPVPPPPEIRSIWGGVPTKNSHFTGRDEVLQQLSRTLQAQSRAAVLPQTLHGLGGVGKTQVAVEFVYRNAHDYDLVWWIAAEESAAVRASLAELGERLELPPAADLSQTAAAVLNALGSSHQRWLLVYDNADQQEDLASLIPSAGGHVIITSRNQDWADSGPAIEVDVFHRSESVDLLTRRSPNITPQDADRLADKLGDLPLALEQAAIWTSSTQMPVAEFIDLFDQHARELFNEVTPIDYRQTATVAFTLAFDRLKVKSLAAAHLLSLFFFLGSDPASVSLLRSGRAAEITPVLREALDESIALGRAIRSLRQFGLAKVAPDGQSVSVHRLVQAILRDHLTSSQRDEARDNVQQILSSANPAEPDNHRVWSLHGEIRPHVWPADLIHSTHDRGLQVVLDQIRYLYAVGDLSGSKLLGETAVREWRKAFQADHELTLLASRHLANTLRTLGDYDRAYSLDEQVLREFEQSEQFGPDHEHTLLTRNSFGSDLRVRGRFQEALESDRENLDRHFAVYQDADDVNVLRTKSNLAVDFRQLGEFDQARVLDEEIVTSFHAIGENTPQVLFAMSNLARDLYGRGEYQAALEQQVETLKLQRQQLTSFHPHVLLTTLTVAQVRRKLGQYDEAVKLSRELYRDYHAKFGAGHEHTLAATMTFANALRVTEQLTEARSLAADACERYRQRFGDEHPFTLAALTNLAIIHRASGRHDEARELDDATLACLTRVLGRKHPYTLASASNFANDLWLNHDEVRARALAEQTHELSVQVRGPLHPDTLSCAVNAALSRRSADDAGYQEFMDSTLAELARVRGPEHPETLDAARGRWAECDIEPPPT